MTVNTCVVADYNCEAPAGWGNSIGYAENTTYGVGNTRCYICEEPVCKSCSSLAIWLGKRVRACSTCIENQSRYGVDIRVLAPVV